MKSVNHLVTLLMLCLTIVFTAMTCETIYSHEIGCGDDDSHTNIYIINRSDQRIWLEWNPRYPMERSDSLFSGFQVEVKDSFNLMPLKSECWEGELRNIPFVRIFLFDASYNSISNHPDSLRAFQNEHLVYQHWYTKKELDSLGWKIYYPPLEIE